MRMKIYTLGFLIFIMTSCGVNQEPIEKTIANKAIEKLKSLPDTVLVSKNIDENEFIADLSDIRIDSSLTSDLEGSWLIENGNFKFLYTRMESGNKVVFHNTERSTMTGWGKIKYNRAANFYSTESVSRIYEFYVTKNGTLDLTEYNYRNDDLSMKEILEEKHQELKLDWINDEMITLSLEGQVATLKKIKE